MSKTDQCLRSTYLNIGSDSKNFRWIKPKIHDEYKKSILFYIFVRTYAFEKVCKAADTKCLKKFILTNVNTALSEWFDDDDDKHCLLNNSRNISVA